MPTLIDPETLTSAHNPTGNNQKPYNLVFFDEFNTPSQLLYAADDSFWTAVDLWYWSTNNLE
jgi:hypothetical protein